MAMATSLAVTGPFVRKKSRIWIEGPTPLVSKSNGSLQIFSESIRFHGSIMFNPSVSGTIPICSASKTPIPGQESHLAGFGLQDGHETGPVPWTGWSSTENTWKYTKHTTGWWFQIFFLFHFIYGWWLHIWDELIFFRGVGQPPTSQTHMFFFFSQWGNHMKSLRPGELL